MKDSGKLKNITKKQWENMYVDRQMSANEIAVHLGCSQPSVLYNLKKHGISARSMSESKRIGWAKNPLPTGKDHWSYKHGVNVHGYCVQKRGGKRQATRVHRLVAEQVLGRPLTNGEVVHHCNEIKTDNRPENLWVFPSQSAHIKYHNDGTIHPDTIFLKDYLNEAKD